MAVLAVLAPVAVTGLIVWLIVGMKQRVTEPLTLATATALYAHLMVIVAATAALCGGVLVVKAVLAFLNMGYSYSGSFFAGSSGSPCPSGAPAGACSPPPQPDFAPQRTQDLVLGLTLILVGVSAAVGHRMLARAIRSSPGGRPLWVERGAAIAFTTLYGFAALFGLIAGAASLVNYFVAAGTPAFGYTNVFPITSAGQPFGELAGSAILFVPAWVVASIYLRRSLTSSAPPPPPTTAAAMT